MPTKEEEYKLVIFVYSCSFLYLYKETNQQCFLRRKKYSRSLDPLSADYPALLEKVGRCETRGVYAP